MKIVVAPDSYKENLSAARVAEAIAAGIHDVAPRAEVVCVPMADGGEGTVDALVDATGGEFIDCEVTDPVGNPVVARFGILGDGRTAVIEMAAASGLPLVSPEDRNPVAATTYGTGELMKAALDRGVDKLLIGIGGSATVDGGAGMAEALGAKLLDCEGRSIGRGGGGLADLDRIDVSDLDERIGSVKVEVACDVENPLTGETGAAQVYGPQKGATPEQVMILDANLGRMAEVMKRDLGLDVASMPGSGAAGGLGAGLVAFAGAVLRPGIEMVVDAVDLSAKIKGADLVITGEGQTDRSSAFGKTPVGVAAVAKEFGIPVVVISGSIGDGAEAVLKCGIDAFFSIMSSPMSLEQAFDAAPSLIRRTASQVTRLFAL